MTRNISCSRLRIADLSGYTSRLLTDDERTKPGRNNGRGHHRRDHDFGQGKASLVLVPRIPQLSH